MRPFFGELWIDPFAKPGFLLAPAQAFIEQNLVDTAALDSDAFAIVQLRY